ncbi:hypothetical protein WA158_005122 [Blastocystis sp. Blastoise]
MMTDYVYDYNFYDCSKASLEFQQIYVSGEDGFFKISVNDSDLHVHRIYEFEDLFTVDIISNNTSIEFKIIDKPEENAFEGTFLVPSSLSSFTINVQCHNGNTILPILNSPVTIYPHNGFINAENSDFSFPHTVIAGVSRNISISLRDIYQIPITYFFENSLLFDVFITNNDTDYVYKFRKEYTYLSMSNTKDSPESSLDPIIFTIPFQLYKTGIYIVQVYIYPNAFFIPPKRTNILTVRCSTPYLPLTTVYGQSLSGGSSDVHYPSCIDCKTVNIRIRDVYSNILDSDDLLLNKVTSDFAIHIYGENDDVLKNYDEGIIILTPINSTIPIRYSIPTSGTYYLHIQYIERNKFIEINNSPFHLSIYTGNPPRYESQLVPTFPYSSIVCTLPTSFSSLYIPYLVPDLSIINSSTEYKESYDAMFSYPSSMVITITSNKNLLHPLTFTVTTSPSFFLLTYTVIRNEYIYYIHLHSIQTGRVLIYIYYGGIGITSTHITFTNNFQESTIFNSIRFPSTRRFEAGTQASLVVTRYDMMMNKIATTAVSSPYIYIHHIDIIPSTLVPLQDGYSYGLSIERESIPCTYSSINIYTTKIPISPHTICKQEIYIHISSFPINRYQLDTSSCYTQLDFIPSSIFIALSEAHEVGEQSIVGLGYIDIQIKDIFNNYIYVNNQDIETFILTIINLCNSVYLPNCPASLPFTCTIPNPILFVHGNTWTIQVRYTSLYIGYYKLALTNPNISPPEAYKEVKDYIYIFEILSLYPSPESPAKLIYNDTDITIDKPFKLIFSFSVSSGSTGNFTFLISFYISGQLTVTVNIYDQPVPNASFTYLVHPSPPSFEKNVLYSDPKCVAGKNCGLIEGSLGEVSYIYIEYYTLYDEKLDLFTDLSEDYSIQIYIQSYVKYDYEPVVIIEKEQYRYKVFFNTIFGNYTLKIIFNNTNVYTQPSFYLHHGSLYYPYITLSTYSFTQISTNTIYLYAQDQYRNEFADPYTNFIIYLHSYDTSKAEGITVVMTRSSTYYIGTFMLEKEGLYKGEIKHIETDTFFGLYFNCTVHPGDLSIEHSSFQLTSSNINNGKVIYPDVYIEYTIYLQDIYGNNASLKTNDVLYANITYKDYYDYINKPRANDYTIYISDTLSQSLTKHSKSIYSFHFYAEHIIDYIITVYVKNIQDNTISLIPFRDPSNPSQSLILSPIIRRESTYCSNVDPLKPLMCPSLLTCVKDIASCPNFNYCSDPRNPYRCWNGVCVSDPQLCTCPTNHNLNKKCLTGQCEASYDDCPIPPLCPLGYRLCLHNQCVPFYRPCPTLYPLCNPGYIMCPDLISCRLTLTDCPNKSFKVTCPSSKPYKCWDKLTCATSSDECPAPVLCSKQKPFLCRDFSCVSDPLLCPPALNCPARTVQCLDRFCTRSYDLCPKRPTCPPEMYASVGTNNCIPYSFAAMIPVPQCNPGNYLCSSGYCASTRALCPTVATCPPNMIRCPSGNCVSSISLCSSSFHVNMCPHNLYKCPTGNCVVDKYMCSYAVICPSSRPILCLHTFVCVVNIEQCPTTQQCFGAFSFHCPFGGCARTVLDCPQRPHCPEETPIICEDNRCVVTPNQCNQSTLKITCNEEEVYCYGGCYKSYEECPTSVTCQKGSYKASDGTCVTVKETQSSLWNDTARDSYIDQCIQHYLSKTETLASCTCTNPRMVRCNGECYPVESCADWKLWYNQCKQTIIDVLSKTCLKELLRVATLSSLPPQCPSDYFLCYDGTCAPSMILCPSSRHCSPNTPILCDNGLCVEDIRLCIDQGLCPDGYRLCPDRTCIPNNMNCKSDMICIQGTFKCWDNTCRSHTYDCPPEPECPLEKPFFCIYTQKCVEERLDCQRVYICNDNQILCPDHTCQVIRKESPEKTCSNDSSFSCPKDTRLCPDGSCISLSQSCFQTKCPREIPIQCPDGRCVINDDECPRFFPPILHFDIDLVGYQCDNTIGFVYCDEETFTIYNGTSLYDSIKTSSLYNFENLPSSISVLNPQIIMEHNPYKICCPNELIYNTTELYRCPNGKYIPNKHYCRSYSDCPTSAPYRCSNGQCVSHKDLCLIGGRCPPYMYACPSGVCATSLSLCFSPPLYVSSSSSLFYKEYYRDYLKLFTIPTGCPPQKPINCGNGECVSSFSSCGTLIPCWYYLPGSAPSSFHVCISTNEIVTSGSTCPLSSPYRCLKSQSEGKCVHSPEECTVDNGCPINRPYLCSDMYCVANKTACFTPSNNLCSIYTPYYSSSLKKCLKYPPTEEASCTEDKPIRCFKNHCEKTINKCPNYVFNNNRDYWSKQILCPNGAIAHDYSLCEMPNGCPIHKPFLCDDHTCVTHMDECPVSLSCTQEKPFMCPDGTCSLSRSTCRLCPHCIYPSSSNITLPFCPPNMPIQCPNGRCVRHTGDCIFVDQLCPEVSPIYCADKRCVTHSIECSPVYMQVLLSLLSDDQIKSYFPSSTTFSSYTLDNITMNYINYPLYTPSSSITYASLHFSNVSLPIDTVIQGIYSLTASKESTYILCSDGTLQSPENCPSIPPCPGVFGRRCNDGTCVSEGILCPNNNNILEECTQGTRCIDGICRILCPYNEGCPVGMVLCNDLRCHEYIGIESCKDQCSAGYMIDSLGNCIQNSSSNYIRYYDIYMPVVKLVVFNSQKVIVPLRSVSQTNIGTVTISESSFISSTSLESAYVQLYIESFSFTTIGIDRNCIPQSRPINTTPYFLNQLLYTCQFVTPILSITPEKVTPSLSSIPKLSFDRSVYFYLYTLVTIPSDLLNNITIFTYISPYWIPANGSCFSKTIHYYKCEVYSAGIYSLVYPILNTNVYLFDIEIQTFANSTIPTVLTLLILYIISLIVIYIYFAKRWHFYKDEYGNDFYDSRDYHIGKETEYLENGMEYMTVRIQKPKKSSQYYQQYERQKAIDFENKQNYKHTRKTISNHSNSFYKKQLPYTPQYSSRKLKESPYSSTLNLHDITPISDDDSLNEDTQDQMTYETTYIKPSEKVRDIFYYFFNGDISFHNPFKQNEHPKKRSQVDSQPKGQNIEMTQF